MNNTLEHYLDAMLQPAPPPAAAEAAAERAAEPALAAASQAPGDPTPTAAPPAPRQHPASGLETRTPNSDGSPAPDRWLIFRLGGQHYAIAVAELQEVLVWRTLTPVPCAPSDVLGLIHRRGAVVPVVDIRHPLGLDDGAPTPAGALVLLPSALGLAVDAIGDVFVPGDDRQPPPSVGTATPAVRALSHHAGETVILLDSKALAATIGADAGTALA